MRRGEWNSSATEGSIAQEQCGVWCTEDGKEEIADTFYSCNGELGGTFSHHLPTNTNMAAATLHSAAVSSAVLLLHNYKDDDE